MSSDEFGLPRDLGDGLLLRWATMDDMDAAAEFNVRIHTENPAAEEFLGHWTRDLMSGDHPTTDAGDFTVVVDTNGGSKIVSLLCLISQKWSYDGIEFGCGRPELVGTDPDYRRRGLVRRQMEAIHAKSEARGDLVQAITGIPWFYRQFGYEMALNHGGARAFFWDRPGNLEKVDEELFQVRPATADDIPQLAELYAAHCADSLIWRVRDEDLWRYELEVAHEETGDHRDIHLVETKDGQVVGYVEYRLWGSTVHVRELGVKPGHSWRPVCLYITRLLKRRVDELNKERKKPIGYISFEFGESHPVYRAIGRQLEKQQRPYAWYIRVPDLPGFLRHIAPVLEKRLASSVLAGHSGTLRLNLYTRQLSLAFERGRFKEIGRYKPKQFAEGDALFPELTILQLIFGYRSFEELDRSRADCYARDAGTAVLLDILFPRRPSSVVGLG